MNMVNLNTRIFAGTSIGLHTCGHKPNLVKSCRTRHKVIGAFFSRPVAISPNNPVLKAGGKIFLMGANRAFHIGSSAFRDDLSVDLYTLGRQIGKPLLLPHHASLRMKERSVELCVSALPGAIVLRAGEKAGCFTSFHLAAPPAVQLKIGDSRVEMALFDMLESAGGAYAVQQYSVPRANIDLKTVNNGGRSMLLDDNDIILLPLGTDYQGNILWLPVIFNEKEIPQPQPQPPQQAVSGKSTLKFTFSPEPDEITLAELQQTVLQEIDATLSSGKQYADLLPQRIKGSIFQSANRHFVKTQGTKLYADFVENYVRAWIIKQAVFFRFLETKGYQVISDGSRSVEPGEKAAALALTLNGSLLFIGTPDEAGKRHVHYKQFKPGTPAVVVSALTVGNRFEFVDARFSGEENPGDNCYNKTTSIVSLAFVGSDDPLADQAAFSFSSLVKFFNG